MKYQRVLLDLLLLLLLAFQTVVGEIELTVDADSSIVYRGNRTGKGVLKITSVTDQDVVQENPQTRYIKSLREHVGQVINVGGQIRQLSGVGDDFVASYITIEVKIQPKGSDNVFSGIYTTQGNLELYHMEDVQGKILEKDSGKIATKLIVHQNIVFYFTLSNCLGVLHDVVQSNAKVCVSVSSQNARFSATDLSEQFYVGIRVQSGVMEINKMEGNNGKTCAIQHVGEELAKAKPKYIYIGGDWVLHSCVDVTSIGNKSFTVLYRKIPIKFSIIVPEGPFYSGHVYKSWSSETTGIPYTPGAIQIVKKGEIPVSKNFDVIKTELETACKNIEKIFIGDQGYIRRLDKVTWPQNKETIIAYYSLYTAKFHVEGNPRTSYAGHLKCNGWITITKVFVGEDIGRLEDYCRALFEFGIGQTLVFGKNKTKILKEVSPLQEGSFAIKYAEA